MSDDNLWHVFYEKIWEQVGDECDPKPSDAFEQSMRIIFDLMEEEEVKELIERVNRDKDADW